MLKVGLTSVTFRDKSAFEVIDYCKECGISAIEWGSDVHVPAGDFENARKVKKACDEAGIYASSYGSYYRTGVYDNPIEEFTKYLETAKILEAPVIRIWVGKMDFEEADSEYIEKNVSELKTICDIAKDMGLQVGCEFHSGTLCNTCESSLTLVEKVGCGNFGMYFQYSPHVSMETNIKTLEKFIPIIKNVHVFWIDKDATRYSLAENGAPEAWKNFISMLSKNNINTHLLFEFLKDPSKEALNTETKILKELIDA